MKFEAHYPVHPELKKHIRYYYFVKTGQNGHHSCYYSFPNTTVPINIHKNVTCVLGNDSVTVSPSATANFQTIANGLRESPLKVVWSGLIDKVTIAFTPAGLNHFINRNLNEAVTGYASFFTEWEGDDYNAFLENFYAETENAKRVSILETFLLGRFHPFEKNDLLEAAISLLTDFLQEIPVPEIAQRTGTSERTFNRLFQEHLGISPAAYRKIARFRQSLEDRVVRQKFKRLTDIAYENNYYDQSYFIKMYNKLSGKSPGDLFKAVDKLADDNVIFEFLNDTIDFG